jgi:transposase InsO family protein
VNHKRIYRLYTDEGLTLKRRRTRRHRSASPQRRRPLAMRPDERWTMDFMHDTLATGQVIRVLTILDAYTRECLGLVVQARFTGGEVAAHLGRLATERQAPGADDHRRRQRDRVHLAGPRPLGLLEPGPARLQSAGPAGRQCDPPPRDRQADGGRSTAGGAVRKDGSPSARAHLARAALSRVVSGILGAIEKTRFEASVLTPPAASP